MIYKIIPPSAVLKAFVKDYTLLHFKAGANQSAPVKPFPANTQHCLVFYLEGSVNAFTHDGSSAAIYPKIAVNGSQINRFNFHLSAAFLMFSVNFHPWVLSKLLRMPLTDLVDDRIDGEAVLPPGIQRVYQQMVNARSHENLVAIVEKYLLTRIQQMEKDAHPIDKVIQLMTEDSALRPVEELASHACLSVSRFERRFMQQTGITPKLFARINRFQRACHLKENRPDLDWLRIALETGYHDYQHLVKDCKQFAGTTPNTLLQAQAKAPEFFFTANA